MILSKEILGESPLELFTTDKLSRCWEGMLRVNPTPIESLAMQHNPNQEGANVQGVNPAGTNILEL